MPATATNTCLALENVSISYGGQLAVSGVFMEIPRGKIGRASCRERV